MNLIENLTNTLVDEQAEAQFELVCSDPEARDDFWIVLDNFFKGLSFRDDFKYSNTSFRWYVILTWKRLDSLDEDRVAQIFSRQIPLALIQGINIIGRLMWYLRLHALTEEKTQSLYIKIQKSFLESEAILGLWKGKEVSMNQVIGEYNLIRQKGDNTLKMAEFFTRLRQIMLAQDLQNYIDPQELINRFLELVDSFQEITKDEIWAVVEEVFMPQPEERRVMSGEISSSAAIFFPGNDTNETQTSQDIISEKEQIKSQIESEFKKDAAGNFENIEEVMARLVELSEQYNKPEIAEMIYFDENEGKFKWKE